MDVDDLTALADILRTVSAPLAEPACRARDTDRGARVVPARRILAWIAGGVHWAKEMLAKYDRGPVGVTPREVYQERYDR